MGKLLLCALLSLISCYKIYPQTSLNQSPISADDSLNYGLKWKNAPIYLRSIPFAIYTGAGKLSDRVAQNIEIGKSFNIIDLGIAYGRNSLRADTTSFVEARITMDVCNMGIFANEMTIGAGKLFDSRGSLMLELTYSIFAQVSTKWGIGIVTGYYDFSNEVYDSSKTFYGFLLRFGLQRTDNGGILRLGRGHGRPGRPGRIHGHGR